MPIPGSDRNLQAARCSASPGKITGSGAPGRAPRLAHRHQTVADARVAVPAAPVFRLRPCRILPCHERRPAADHPLRLAPGSLPPSRRQRLHMHPEPWPLAPLRPPAARPARRPVAETRVFRPHMAAGRLRADTASEASPRTRTPGSRRNLSLSTTRPIFASGAACDQPIWRSRALWCREAAPTVKPPRMPRPDDRSR